MVALAVIGGGFLWRLVDLQLTPDPDLADGIGSQIRHEEIAAPRGEILDRYGRPIAFSLPRPSIVANPRLFQSDDLAHPEEDRLTAAVEALADVLSTPPEVIRERLGRDKAFVYLERQVDPEIGEAVRALGIAGVYTEDEQRREHPHGDCSGLGVVGRVDADQRGVSGLEFAYDDHLTGTPGALVRQTQAGGDVQIPGGSSVIAPMVPGRDLYTTLDRSIQFESERLIQAAVADAGADGGSIVIGDTRTGEILAMANVARDEETDVVACTTNNLAATAVYEPGSIMKPITFASVFEHDAWPEYYPIDIPYELFIANVSSHSYEDHSVPVEGESHTPTWVLRKSSNNGTILMAQELGAEALYSTMVDFGLGQTTGSGIHGEASGILEPLDTNALDLSNAAIGQAAAVTPLQMLRAFSALGNGGLRTDPVLVGEDVGRSEPVRVVSQDTADTVVQMMRQVVIDGTGRLAAVPGYDVAGKTGTAQQPCDGGVGYACEDGSYQLTASFAGVIGNDAGAALTIIVVIDNPRGERTGGGELAAPVFADVATFALRQLKIAPLAEAVRPDGRVRAAAAVSPVPAAEGADREAP